MNESNHPSPEVLAAFVDGRLRGEERRGVVAHLDACPECYEVFAETVRFQGEEEPRGHVLRPPRFAAKRWLGWAAAAAALVAVAVALPILRMQSERPVHTARGAGELALSSEAVVAAIEVPDDAALAVGLWDGWPGGGLGFTGTGLDRKGAAFRAGVWLVDLRAAERARDGDAARGALAGLAGALEAADAATELEGAMEEAREAAERGRFHALATAAAELEAGAEELLDPVQLAFGKWAEAGRLAAAMGDREFFQSPEFVGFREELEGRELPAPTAETLQEIHERTREELGPPEDLAALGAAFRTLIGRAGRSG